MAIAGLPLVFLVAVQLYAREFDGWRRWSAAPIFLLPVIASGVVTAMGIAICRREAGAGRSLAPVAGATLAAAIPALWFLARVFVS